MEKQILKLIVILGIGFVAIDETNATTCDQCVTNLQNNVSACHQYHYASCVGDAWGDYQDCQRGCSHK